MREQDIAWWRGRIKPGVAHEMACSMDLFNTSLALAGAAVPTDRAMDGVNLTPILFGDGKSLRDTVIYYRGNELFAVRKGNFKMHVQTAPGYGSPGNPLKFEKHDPPLLFNLAADPGEKVDVAGKHPEVVAEMRKLLAEHQTTLVQGKPQY